MFYKFYSTSAFVTNLLFRGQVSYTCA